MEGIRVSEAQLRTILCGLLEKSSGEVRRKQLVEACVRELGLDESDTRPDSAFTQAKNHIGSILTALIHTGYIAEGEAGCLRLQELPKLHYSAFEVRACITQCLEEGKLLSKQALFRRAEEKFSTDKTTSRKDDNALRSAMGRELLAMEQEGNIRNLSRGYRLADGDQYPVTELGGYLREAANGGDLKRCFLEAVHTKGGEWFESYCVNLLRAYYRMSGKQVDEGEVTGGSDDGGIDGILHTTDDLGYRETILMQMKNRHAVMTAKDLREFYGAVCAEKGSRGIFITLSRFHPEAQRLMDKVDNLTGIDGDKLFEIAAKCHTGLVEHDGALHIDEDLLLNT